MNTKKPYTNRRATILFNKTISIIEFRTFHLHTGAGSQRGGGDGRQGPEVGWTQFRNVSQTGQISDKVIFIFNFPLQEA